jgi:putative dimethyl sulfoxide reductase chaperone
VSDSKPHGDATRNTEALESILSARAFAYDLLKSVFLQEPSKELVALLVEQEAVNDFPFSENHPDLAQAANRVAAYLKEQDATSDDNCNALRWDYTRLFVGPGKVPAPPFESVYRDAAQLYFSPETLEVRQAYCKYNLLPAQVGREPDDHIGLELDFMEQLCAGAREKAKARDDKALAGILHDQLAFLDQHLLQWAPRWSEDVINGAHTNFYRGMAALLREFIELDRKIVAELLDTLPQTPRPG